MITAVRWNHKSFHVCFHKAKILLDLIKARVQAGVRSDILAIRVRRTVFLFVLCQCTRFWMNVGMRRRSSGLFAFNIWKYGIVLVEIVTLYEELKGYY